VVRKKCDCCGDDVEISDNDERTEILCNDCGEAMLGIIEEFATKDKGNEKNEEKDLSP